MAIEKMSLRRGASMLGRMRQKKCQKGRRKRTSGMMLKRDQER